MMHSLKIKTNEFLKLKSKEFLLRHGSALSNKTADRALIDFFGSVKPVKTNYDLVRIGGERDGGYLIPDDLVGIDTCFSPGVSKNASFESDLTARGIHCYLADYSVESAPIENPLVDFLKKYLGTTDDDVYTTLQTWVNHKAPHSHDLLLQMDIEGAEYAVILDTPLEILEKFRIIVIEFHELDDLFAETSFKLIDLSFSKLLKYFEIVHIHPNNWVHPVKCNNFTIPPAMEFTFLRKDRVLHKQRNTDFPHRLDRANNADNRDFPLPKCWY